MTRKTELSAERARSRGTEGSIVLVMVVGGLAAAIASTGVQLAHLLGGLGRLLP
jgi:hypothetical protein